MLPSEQPRRRTNPLTHWRLFPLEQVLETEKKHLSVLKKKQKGVFFGCFFEKKRTTFSALVHRSRQWLAMWSGSEGVGAGSRPNLKETICTLLRVGCTGYLLEDCVTTHPVGPLMVCNSGSEQLRDRRKCRRAGAQWQRPGGSVQRQQSVSSLLLSRLVVVPAGASPGLKESLPSDK